MTPAEHRERLADKRGLPWEYFALFITERLIYHGNDRKKLTTSELIRLQKYQQKVDKRLAIKSIKAGIVTAWLVRPGVTNTDSFKVFS